MTRYVDQNGNAWVWDADEHAATSPGRGGNYHPDYAQKTFGPLRFAADVDEIARLAAAVAALRQQADEARARAAQIEALSAKAVRAGEARIDEVNLEADMERKLIKAVDFYRSAAPAEPAPRVWTFPPEPGLEVTRVVDRFGQYWERQHDDHPGDDLWIGTEFAAYDDVDEAQFEWGKLMGYQAPLTDATPAPAWTPAKVGDTPGELVPGEGEQVLPVDTEEAGDADSAVR